jgi:hypothetical protein
MEKKSSFIEVEPLKINEIIHICCLNMTMAQLGEKIDRSQSWVATMKDKAREAHLKNKKIKIKSKSWLEMRKIAKEVLGGLNKMIE